MTVSREAVLHYAKRKYITEPDYPWAKFSNYAVLRHKENSKWFGLLMDVDKEKLNIEGEGTVDVLNVKCDPELSSILRKENGILPAYHMNKEHWISILLDGSISEDEIFQLVDASYHLTV
ncbi:MmcQ/YjbR family DNA-binding protein [Oceanobacillus oncorhynchi subsp. oncorhynchi]|uniref:MmcQ/YjbR family DNA-binding protein n=1 Tax=Oceanobacillus oncorhynchi TaxID=545501 RepID=UPI003628E045